MDIEERELSILDFISLFLTVHFENELKRNDFFTFLGLLRINEYD